MLPSLDIAAIAREIRQAQEQVRQLRPFTSRIENFDLEVAYKVAKLLHDERLKSGAVPVGRKIGFTNPDMWAIYGVRAPIWGYVYDTTLFRVEGGSVTCPLGAFTEPKIEPELVLHFRSAPPVGDNPAAILACVDWIAPAFEIVQSHFPGWAFQAPDTVADGALHGTLLLGTPLQVEPGAKDLVDILASFSVTLSCNGNVREVGRGSNVLGNPLAAISHLTSELDRQQAPPLQAGELITTGTLTTAQPIKAGEVWTSAISGIELGELKVTFTP